MFQFHGRGARPGWTCVEVVVVVILIVLLASLLLALAPQARREARLAMDLSNLGKIGAYTGSYAADHDELVWGYSWRAGLSPSQYPDLRQATTDVAAAANQAVDAIRRLGGFETLAPIHGWIPHIHFSQLPLLEYLGAPLSNVNFVSAGDRDRLNWVIDHEAFLANAFRPCQPVPSGSELRWLFSSSYQMPPAWFDRATEPAHRVAQAGSNGAYYVGTPNHRLGRASFADVAYPADKVLLHDAASWHTGRRAFFFLTPPARITMLMADGSAGLRATQDSNQGWIPTEPTSPAPTTMSFHENSTCPHGPRTSNGQFEQMVTGYYRWTRQGIGGRDFGGPEVD